LEKKVKEIELTWATVDTDDEEEMTRFEEQELQKAGERIKKAAQELQDLGIVDEKGRRVKKSFPPTCSPGPMPTSSFADSVEFAPGDDVTP
jgi:hypothetical protein